MTLLKQFPSASMTKEIYRSKVMSNKRLSKSIHSRKEVAVISENKELDHNASNSQESMEDRSIINNHMLEQSVSLNDKSARSINEGYKASYHLSLKRHQQEKRQNGKPFRKSLYIHIKDDNLKKVKSSNQKLSANKEHLTRVIADQDQELSKCDHDQSKHIKLEQE